MTNLYDMLIKLYNTAIEKMPRQYMMSLKVK